MDPEDNNERSTYQIILLAQTPPEILVSGIKTHPDTISVHWDILRSPQCVHRYRVTTSLWISYGLSFLILVLSLIAIFLHTHSAWLFSFPATVSTLSIIHSVTLYGRIAMSSPEEQRTFFVVPSPRATRPSGSSRPSRDSTKHTSREGLTRFLQISTWSIMWPMWVLISIILLILSTTSGRPPNSIPKVVLTRLHIMCALSWVEMGVVFLMGWLIVKAGQGMEDLKGMDTLESGEAGKGGSGTDDA